MRELYIGKYNNYNNNNNNNNDNLNDNLNTPGIIGGFTRDVTAFQES